MLTAVVLMSCQLKLLDKLVVEYNSFHIHELNYQGFIAFILIFVYTLQMVIKIDSFETFCSLFRLC